MAAAARARPLLLLAPAVLASSRWPAFDALALLQAPAPREAARQPPAWQGQLMRVGTERRALGGNVPQFLLCQTEVGDPCDATAPVRWFSDFFGVIDGQMRELAGAGRTPAIMHIGANDFGDDAASYRALFGALSSGRGSFRVVLVEPDSKTAGQLRSTVLDRLGLPQGSVQVVEAAIKADCSESMNMYAFSDQMFEDFIRSPIERFCVRSSMQSWRSFDKMQPLRALKGVATQPMMDQTNLDAAGGAAGYDVFHKLIVPWAKRMLLAGNASAYVRRVPVRCLTPAGLLREVWHLRSSRP